MRGFIPEIVLILFFSPHSWINLASKTGTPYPLCLRNLDELSLLSYQHREILLIKGEEELSNKDILSLKELGTNGEDHKYL